MKLNIGGKKKALVLFCSPQGHGHTRRLLDAFLHPFSEDKAWQVEEMDLYSLNPHPCIGCKACAKKEACAFDDLDVFDRSLRESDLLVVASPVYNSSFPAPMKALLDRAQRYFEARFSLGKKSSVKKHREAVLLLSQGSEEPFALEVAAYQLRRSFSVMNTTLSGCAVWQGTDRGDEGWTQARRQAEQLAEACRNPGET